MKTIASFVTGLVASMIALFVAPPWLEADLFWAFLAASGIGLLVVVLHAALAAAYNGVGERGGDK